MSISKPRLAVVVGSIRPNRFADHPAQWIAEIARQRGDFDVEVIDLKDYPMPLFAEEASPLYAPSKSEVARRWQQKVAGFDAYVFTAAEYNRGPAPVLKNALDYAYREWSNKPVAFVGYGGVGGARAVEQLLLNAIECGTMCALHISNLSQESQHEIVRFVRHRSLLASPRDTCSRAPRRLP